MLTKAKLLIGHNATDEGTGFQGFADGDPWSSLVITGPDAAPIVSITAGDTFSDFGLTELFFGTNEPANAEVPIPEVLARLPEGTYTFTGEMVGGDTQEIVATLTHAIPADPVLTSPSEGATDVDPDDTLVQWEDMTTDIAGNALTIVGYEVIVATKGGSGVSAGLRPPGVQYLRAGDGDEHRDPAAVHARGDRVRVRGARDRAERESEVEFRSLHERCERR